MDAVGAREDAVGMVKKFGGQDLGKLDGFTMRGARANQSAAFSGAAGGRAPGVQSAGVQERRSAEAQPWRSAAGQ